MDTQDFPPLSQADDGTSQERVPTQERDAFGNAMKNITTEYIHDKQDDKFASQKESPKNILNKPPKPPVLSPEEVQNREKIDQVFSNPFCVKNNHGIFIEI